MSRLLAALTTTLLACACALPGPALAAKKTYFRVGNAADATATTTAGTVLMGGSTDVDAAFQWLCARATGGDCRCSALKPAAWRSMWSRNIRTSAISRPSSWWTTISARTCMRYSASWPTT